MKGKGSKKLPPKPFLGGTMTPEQCYGELLGVLTQLGVEMRVESMGEEAYSWGGLCTMKGKTLLILDRKLNIRKRNQLIIRSLRKFDMDQIYLKPFVREMIEKGSAPTENPQHFS